MTSSRHLGTSGVATRRGAGISAKNVTTLTSSMRCNAWTRWSSKGSLGEQLRSLRSPLQRFNIYAVRCLAASSQPWPWPSCQLPVPLPVASSEVSMLSMPRMECMASVDSNHSMDFMEWIPLEFYGCDAMDSMKHTMDSMDAVIFLYSRKRQGALELWSKWIAANPRSPCNLI